jgi:hypothetical protein
MTPFFKGAIEVRQEMEVFLFASERTIVYSPLAAVVIAVAWYCGGSFFSTIIKSDTGLSALYGALGSIATVWDYSRGAPEEYVTAPVWLIIVVVAFSWLTWMTICRSMMGLRKWRER